VPAEIKLRCQAQLGRVQALILQCSSGSTDDLDLDVGEGVSAPQCQGAPEQLNCGLRVTSHGSASLLDEPLEAIRVDRVERSLQQVARFPRVK
jgi:hypothetical protein